MENLVQPSVFITPEGKNYKPPKNWKPLILVIIAILVIGGLGFAGFYYRNFISKNFQIISKRLGIERFLASQAKKPPSAINTDKTPILFYADLEYDPKSGAVMQLETGKTGGNMPDYYSSLSSMPVSDFNYRISVMSAKNILLQNGWMAVAGNSSKTPKNTYKFRVITTYEKDAIVRVYSKEYKMIWTTKMI